MSHGPASASPTRSGPGFVGAAAIDARPGDLAAATAQVNAFVPRDRIQALHRRRLIGFAARHPDALHRSCAAGHLTASAWVVNHDATQGLVLLHRKIGRWLQPGGHADGEGSLSGVALREATEETGIDGLEIWTEPVDIDVHLFVNRRHPEPDHLHFDVRFLVRAPRCAVMRGNHESEELRWIGRDELTEPELGLDASTRRLARYGFDLARIVN
ncbi:NUDIX hydrolase [Candidatus Poriferisodalis sp.]|uniref:NUDIX hydrolase n=1 Tax=Candidatus Poriferisodalis sp. TaxID=3101277 RepID=UPI003B014E55